MHRLRSQLVAVAVLVSISLLPGAALSTPVISASPDSLNFPPTQQGQGGGSGIATVFNSGTTDLIVTSATTTHVVFGVTTWQFPIVVPTGGNANILNRFEPIDPVFYAGYMVIQSNDPVTPTLMIPMTGQGLPGPPPDIDVVPTFVSEDVIAGAQGSATFRIWNHGFQTLDFSIDDSGFPPWFGLSSTSDSILGGSSRLIWVNYDATGIPQDSTLIHTLYVDHNDSTRASVGVTIQMNTLPVPMPQIVLSDSAFAFGDLFIPNTAVVVLTISNMGPDPLTGTIAAPSNDYFVSDPAFSVSPGFMHYTTIDFLPGTSGIYEDTLVISSNDPDEGRIELPMYGRAVELTEFDVTPDSLPVTLPPGATRDVAVEIHHPGGFDTGFVLSSYVVHPEDPQGIAASRVSSGGGVGSAPPARATLAPWETGASVQHDGRTGAARAGPDLATPTMYTPLPFVDDFEDGDHAGWRSGGGAAVHDVTSTTAANGSSLSLRESQSSPGHSNGLFLEFGFVRLTDVSFWVRAVSRSDNACYVTFHDRDGAEVIFFFALSTGQFYINDNVGGNTLFTYQADTWYHVELRNIDFDTHSFDYYVDDGLVQAGVPFRNAGAITHIARMDIYNHSSGATGYWDEIELAGDFPDWIMASPDTVMVPAGGGRETVFSVDATGLPAGTYKGYVQVHSVDRPVTIATVPVTLSVDSTATSAGGAPPLAISLAQNYPNPFNPTTNIEFYVAAGGRAALDVFDVSGRHVRTLFARDPALGRYVVTWDSRDRNGAPVASGIYFYRLRTPEGTATRKMVLLK